MYYIEEVKARLQRMVDTDAEEMFTAEDAQDILNALQEENEYGYEAGREGGYNDAIETYEEEAEREAERKDAAEKERNWELYAEAAERDIEEAQEAARRIHAQ